MRSTLLASTLLLALIASAVDRLAVAQTAPPPGSVVTESTAVTAVEIPVTVTGRDGRPLANLKVGDFELYDDGKRQEISGIDVVDLQTIRPADTPPMARRHWLLVFDLTYTSPKGLARAKEGAKDFVSRAITASDLVGVATLSIETGWNLLVNFTQDRASLTRAVEAVGTSAAAFTNADPLALSLQIPVGDSDAGRQALTKQIAAEEAKDFQRMLDKGNDALERGRVAQLVGTLGAVARTLDSVRGRKHVLFFSEGFDSRLLSGSDRSRIGTGVDQPTSNEDSANEQSIHGRTWNVDSDARFGNSGTRSRLADALGAFRRSDTVLHSVDVTGLFNQAADASNAKKASGRDALFTMANETDGELVKNANELSGELQKVADRTSLVYVLVYQPKKLQKPGTFHELRVRVSASGARVSARAGYYEPRPFASLSPLERKLATGDLLTGGGDNALALTLLAAPFPAEPGRAIVPVILELPGPALLAGAPGPQVPIQLYTYAIDSAGTMRDYATQDLTLDLTRLKTALQNGGIKYYTTLSLVPGDFVVRAVARNVATGRSGNASVALQVPPMPGGPAYVVAPLFEAPPSGWLLVKKPPTPGQPNPEYPFSLGTETFIPAAVPIVDPSAESRIALVTYNFPGGSTPPPLDVRMELSDSAGKTWPGKVRTAGQTRVEKGAARKLLLAFQPEGLPPGRYRMKIVVSEKDSGASAEGSTAFEVREQSSAPSGAAARKD